jgi:hypothetical protein
VQIEGSPSVDLVTFAKERYIQKNNTLKLCTYLCLLAALTLVVLLGVVVWLFARGSSALAGTSFGAAALLNAILGGGIFLFRNSLSHEHQTHTMTS